jgi:isoleucyl-tRNA synthetase
MFKPVDIRVSFPKLEETILEFWEKNRIFEKSLDKNRGKKRFVFYEGPPTANGKPHIGHFITRVFKDVFPRYKTMQGYYVERKGGWDTHGLPVEVEVEKELKISGKEQIENIVKGDRRASIIKFNELCRKNVWKYIDLWEKMIKRIGNWIDLKNAYVTYENYYIESIWWSLSELYKKKLLYRGLKVVPYCTRCETPLSSHEVAQDYRETEDPSIFVKFPLMGEKNTYFLAWTTTPWTLPGNVALAVDKFRRFFHFYFTEQKKHSQ